jgi:hypothetical protein
LIEALGHTDSSIRETAADLLGQIGQPVMEPVLNALQDPKQEAGALLALQRLPIPPEEPIEEYARAAISRAVEYDCLMRAVRSTSENGAVSLLAESLQRKTRLARDRLAGRS